MTWYCPTPSHILVCLLMSGFAGSSAHSTETSPASSKLSPSINQSLKPETTKSRRFILTQLVNDFTYLTGQPDFYVVAGALVAVPVVLPGAFRSETAEITEIWGNSRFADNLLEIGEIIGDGAFPVAIATTSWATGRLTGSPGLAGFGADLFRAQVSTGLFTTTFKRGIDRKRPDGTPYSYPSGHTSSAFATAGTVYAHFGKLWGLPAFAIAGYVGISRLQEGKHYISDIVAGGLLGTYVSLKLARQTGSPRRSLSFAPMSIDGHPAISVALRF